MLFNLFKGLSFLAGEPWYKILWLGICKFLVSVIGGILVGLFIALITTICTRAAHMIPHAMPLLFAASALLSYCLADALLFSGVVSVMVVALFLARYAAFNLGKGAPAAEWLLHGAA